VTFSWARSNFHPLKIKRHGILPGKPDKTTLEVLKMLFSAKETTSQNAWTNALILRNGTLRKLLTTSSDGWKTKFLTSSLSETKHSQVLILVLKVLLPKLHGLRIMKPQSKVTLIMVRNDI
jgi:hypothetical protein